MKKITILILMAAMLAVLGGAQAATMLDLTASPYQYTVNGAIFNLSTAQPTGVGVFDPFLTISAKDVETGYNTDWRPYQFDEFGNAARTHALLLSTIPTLDIDGVCYREFMLDVNQEANGPISLDTLKLYQSNDPMLHNYSTGWPSPIYDMGSDYWINVPGGSGSGSGDMGLYVPCSLFDTTKLYVELYSTLGVTVGANAGYDAWGVRSPNGNNVVPESSSIILAMSGLSSAGMMGWLRRKIKR